MTHDALTQQERDAVRYSIGPATRSLGPGLTRDDLMQEGRIAAWRARDVLAAIDDDRHRLNSLRRRVLGAMIDANRAALCRHPHYVFSLDEEDDEGELGSAARTAASPDRPERAMQLREVVAQIIRRGTPQLVECMTRLLEGSDARDVARDMQLCETRVSQMRRQARAIASECW